MSQLTQLTNIGTTLAGRLEAIGIKTRTDLKKLGPAKCYQLLQAKHPDSHLPVCYYLYSLQGALEDRDWRDLTDAEKLKLRTKAGVE